MSTNFWNKKFILQNWFKPIYDVVKYIVQLENRTFSSNRVLWNRALDRILYLPLSYLLLKVTSLLSSKCSHSGAESTLEFWTQGGNNNRVLIFLLLFLLTILKPSAHQNPTIFLEYYLVDNLWSFIYFWENGMTKFEENCVITQKLQQGTLNRLQFLPIFYQICSSYFTQN